MSDYFKLTEEDLSDLIKKNLINLDQFHAIKSKSLNRTPGEFDKEPLYIYLNKSKTIRLSSIHFYGGEHFKQPYYWIAELQGFSTDSHTSRWLNKYGLDYSSMTY
jgi:hypothetical protein